ncbi:hypothetical protein DL771_006208 [Monosporascus sp. 5C6A]|nr:hypothetical protein DL771_006208 [Monosporascus sp. 5C6A]
MAVDGSARGGSVQVPTPSYSVLQEWILQQQEYEAMHSRPAPLTAAQRRLLTELELALTVTPTEPEVGDTNWIGILLEYRAANQIYPGDSAVEFAEEAAPASPGHPAGAVRWRCQVRIEERRAAPFPSPSPEPPSFARKKDAKQFAARCAVEWLRANGHMPPDGVRFPKGMAAAAAAFSLPPQQLLQQQGKKRRASPVNVTFSNPSLGPSNGCGASTSGKRPPSSPSSPTTEARSSSYSPSSPFGADERPATDEVSELCRNLGWRPPRYVLKEDPQNQGFWSGHPEFDNPGPLPTQLPAPAGRVEGAYGKKLARQQIAEGVLPFIQRAWEARQAEIRAFMSGL